MQPIVVADVRISEAEYVSLSNRLLKRRRLATLGLTIAIIAYLIWTNGDFNDPTFLLVYAGMLVFLFAISLWQAQKKLKKIYRSTPSIQQAATYTFTADSIAIQSLVSQSTISWSNILSIQILEPWFIITTAPGVNIPVDGRLVQAPHTASDLAAALAQRGTNLSSSSARRSTKASGGVSRGKPNRSIVAQ